MTRKPFKPAAWALPQPVSIIGTYDETGTPNAMNAAWTGQYDDTQVILCLSAGHKTTKNIMARRDFTLSFATRDQMAACDYVGMASGNTTPDKVARTGWTVHKAGQVNAPVFEELPLTLECRMTSQTGNGNIVADIVNITCDEAFLDADGRPDVRKMQLLSFNPVNRTYLVVDQEAGQAWNEGRKLLQAAVAAHAPLGQ
ncbi:flavin reductase family protein [Faecalibaculum rodentium]|uniref:flavin reductase family protein n=2 Tax=Faecalibaculum rodentium TaxID=1702221 RepID=UPI0023F560B6|nr:flavin reductase [Faecalibaculum rodentium]